MKTGKKGNLISVLTIFLIITCLGGSGLGIVTPDQVEPVFQATGSLHVDGDPVGMEIALDGNVTGYVNESGVLVIDAIPVGEHTLNASLQGYKPQEMFVDVPDGLPVEVRLNLEKESEGSLEIDSTPPNVQVYIDDLYKGITPARFQLPVGPHIVLLRLAGYQDWKSPVTITAEQPVQISGTLEPIGTSPVSTPKGGPGMVITLIMSGISCMIVVCFYGRGR